jgi:hypothetical protein
MGSPTGVPHTRRFPATADDVRSGLGAARNNKVAVVGACIHFAQGRTSPDPTGQQARGFLEKLRKETDKFNAQIASGIDRTQLEATSDALLAMKRNLLAMSDGSTLAVNREEEDIGKKSKPRRGKKAA